MKIILDDSPARLEIESPHGEIIIDVWPGQHTKIMVAPNENHSDYCARGERETVITLKPRES
jgi:hypothetical protein